MFQNDPAQQPTTIQIVTLTLSILGFIGSFVLGWIRLLEFLRTAELEVSLTRDAFVRLTDNGEALFCQVSMLARRGPVLVKKVSIELSKIGGTVKSFPLEIVHVGTLISKPEKLFADHQFWGSSQQLYLVENQPQRIVYFCLQRDYRENQAALSAAFIDEVKELKNQRIQETYQKNEDGAGVTPPIFKLDEVEPLAQKHLERMMGGLQLEPSDYRLSALISYECPGVPQWRKQKEKTASSAITFALPPQRQRASRVGGPPPKFCVKPAQQRLNSPRLPNGATDQHR
jgi:hypothetical protein